MENAFGRVVAVIAMAFAIFIAPILINLEKVNYIRTIAVTTQTVEFVDNVRNRGYIDLDIYDDYKRSLSKMNLICDVELEHKYQGQYSNGKVWLLKNSNDIEEYLYDTGFYDFKIGDYFKIVVYARNGDSREVLAYYGGSIRNERS